MEDQNKISVKDVAIRYGFILGLVWTLFSLVTTMTGMTGNFAVGLVAYAIMIAVIVMAQNYFKNEGNGMMTYSQGLGIGTLIGAIGAIINSIVLYLYVKLIDDSVLTVTRELQIQQMEERGMSQEQMDQALEMTSFLSTPEFMYGIAFVAGTFICFVLSLIITAFTKKEPTN